MKPSIHVIIVIIFFYMSITEVIADKSEQIVIEYEHNIDQQVVSVFPADKNEHSIIFLYKKYLEQRKSKVNIERSKTIVYEIRNNQNTKVVPFLTFDFSDSHFIGKILKVADGYWIPVTHSTKQVQIFLYRSSDQTVKSIDLPAFSNKNGVVRQLFHIKDGYLAVIAFGDTIKLVYQAYDTSIQTVIDINSEKRRIVSVNDISEFNGRIYIISSALKSIDQASNSIWLFSFDNRFSKESMQSLAIKLPMTGYQQAEFISTTHNYPSLQVLTRTKKYVPPTVHIFKIEDKIKKIWQLDLSEIEGNHDAQVAGICSDKYLFVRKVKANNTIFNSVEYKIISLAGKEIRTWKEQMVINGSLLNVGIFPITDYFFTVSNFSKTEEVRRQDGWYSWLGFRVDKTDIRKDCD
ncbi:hypothetical protein [Methylobacter psychrophilus]|uniref:hypothetical protein n=1 Tax=Methylobacter psychrophilus TaxID=96941 RepID=UPI0021D50FED|nr:hypothetical protein [Methylobacter psychrophilus]